MFNTVVELGGGGGGRQYIDKLHADQGMNDTEKCVEKAINWIKINKFTIADKVDKK